MLCLVLVLVYSSKENALGVMPWGHQAVERSAVSRAVQVVGDSSNLDCYMFARMCGCGGGQGLAN